MADRATRLVLDDFSGGRNAVDSPVGPNFAKNQVTDAVNGDWYHTNGFRKRHGSSALSMSGTGFSGIVSWMARHVPATSEADAELWALEAASPPTIVRLDNSATWTGVPSISSPVFGTNTFDFTSASLNGKLFIAWPTTAGRQSVYDPATGNIRPTGIAPGSNAPTIGPSGVSGSYSATLQYFRVRWGFSNAGAYQLLSEATPSASFTPGGADTGVVITRPTAPDGGIGPTNIWFVEGSTDNVTFYVLAGIVIGTLNYTNTVEPALWSNGSLAPLTGTYTTQKNYKFIAADQNRIIGFGSYTAADPKHRVEWSAIVGGTYTYFTSASTGAEERVDTTVQSYLDLDENDSSVPTALIGPLWGNFYPFKSRQMWELAPTGSTDQPYRKTAISKELGCVGPHAVCRGEDGQGNPAMYFMSHRGVYRYGNGGLMYIGFGIEDLVLGPTSVLNTAATNSACHMVYHQEKRQLWVWHATGSSNDPNVLSMFDVRANHGEGGWARYTGTLASARCSVMFADSIGTTMGTSLVPYTGYTGAVNAILKVDDAAATTDTGTAFRAYVTTRPLEVPGFMVATGDAMVLAPTAEGVSLTAIVTPDFGATDGQKGEADLSALDPTTTPTRVSRRFEGTALAQAEFIQVTVGDEVANDSVWSLDRIVIPISKQQALS